MSQKDVTVPTKAASESRFLTSDQPLRAIVVTSTMRQEDKSTVAANLAAAMV